jgi:hypothetical protein
MASGRKAVALDVGSNSAFKVKLVGVVNKRMSKVNIRIAALNLLTIIS